MAKRIEHIILDDINGEAGAEPRTFELDGSAYEIDLNPKNSAALNDALALFVAHARRAGRSRKGGVPARHRVAVTSGEVATSDDRKAIRAWWVRNQAKLNLPGVSQRGRIPESVVTAYREASQSVTTAAATPDVPPAPAEAPKTGRAGRKAIPQPPVNELLEAYRKEGSLKGLAGVYGVSTATAARWINNAQLAQVA